MTDIDFEAEYNNRQRVPEHTEIQARWAQASARFRNEAKADLDLTYGPRERNRLDLYHSASGLAGSPLVLYVHGGYWQRGSREDTAFVARELVARGLSVAVASYTLCPDVSVIEIVGEMQAAVRMLWGRLRRRPVVVGHSAGGHLAASMLATSWAETGGLPADLVRSSYAISGVFDLPPLIGTSLNAALSLTPESAREASPLTWPPPSASRTSIAAVGGQESQEFIRQSLDLTAAWSAAGVKAECVIVPDTNHFTIVDELCRAESAMVARIVELALASAKD
ncbi:MAG TPA: alpha/beta hydrolase [Hyphomicrobiaceae bacterium]|nr:alpha/beta hydrolase [Hyphomicrobiaceae bacterium]